MFNVCRTVSICMCFAVICHKGAFTAFSQIDGKIKVKRNRNIDSLKETRTEEFTVYGASRIQQKITDAPAAISVLLPKEITRAASHGQVAKSIENIQGVDVVQSGMNDFNVNMRGFNNSINRRVLILLDGRDPSTPLLNLVEWNSFQTNMGDIAHIEVVRGPGLLQDPRKAGHREFADPLGRSCRLRIGPPHSVEVDALDYRAQLAGLHHGLEPTLEGGQ